LLKVEILDYCSRQRNVTDSVEVIMRDGAQQVTSAGIIITAELQSDALL